MHLEGVLRYREAVYDLLAPKRPSTASVRPKSTISGLLPKIVSGHFCPSRSSRGPFAGWGNCSLPNPQKEKKIAYWLKTRWFLDFRTFSKEAMNDLPGPQIIMWHSSSSVQRGKGMASQVPRDSPPSSYATGSTRRQEQEKEKKKPNSNKNYGASLTQSQLNESHGSVISRAPFLNSKHSLP